MKSIYNFVVSPVGSRYNNKKKVGNKELILNSEIYNHEYVNRKAIVCSSPTVSNVSIRKGDEVIVHHNVFRRWHDVKGNERNSKAWFSEDKYIVSPDQVFLYKDKNIWNSMPGFCFVEPLKSKNNWDVDIEHPTKGVIKYTDGSFLKGDIVDFTPFSKYEFIIDGEKLYRVYSKFITIKYEHKGNEETYNPSWAQSS